GAADGTAIADARDARIASDAAEDGARTKDAARDVGDRIDAPLPPDAGFYPCAGAFLLCDDFDGAAIDTPKWIVRDTLIARQPVRPENVHIVAATDDDGARISVVDAEIFGDLHTPMRQGGLLITQKQYGGGRYEARMKSLPGPNGCTCMWNYYDSLNEPNPPTTRHYTQIDHQKPPHNPSPPAWSSRQRIPP